MDGDENVYGTDYNYAHDLVPTEWDVERVRGVLDRIPDDRVPITFSTEDDIVDRIVSSAEAGIDMIRFSDRSAEIHPAMRWRLTDLYVRAADRARAILAAG
jgi:hypothetical protein